MTTTTALKARALPAAQSSPASAGGTPEHRDRPTHAVAQSAGGAARERDALIDNARFVLIVLVVFGHFLTTMRGDPALDVLYSWIYMFHMPAFVFLSGLVVNAEAVTARQGRRIVSGLIAPLVIFTLLYEAFGRLIGQPVPSDTSLMDPYWLLWFLVALTIWRLLVPVLRSLRWPVATTLVVASVLVLISDLPAEWSIDRVVVLLPFFTAGLTLTPERLRALRTRTWRLVGAGVLAVSVPIAIWATDLPAGFITFSDGVTSIGDLPEFLGMYVIATAMIVALLALIPSRRSLITTWGARTIYVYLLHGFFVRAFRAGELGEVFASPTGAVLVLILSVGLAIFLSSDFVLRRTRRLVEPRVEWLLRAEPQPAAQPAAAVATPAGAAVGPTGATSPQEARATSMA